MHAPDVWQKAGGWSEKEQEAKTKFWNKKKKGIKSIFLNVQKY